MKKTILQLLVFGFLLASQSLSTFAQSQALNGQIEGTVSDHTGAPVQGAIITASNIETPRGILPAGSEKCVKNGSL